MLKRLCMCMASIVWMCTTIAFAGPCLDVPNRIYHDIRKYGTDLSQQQLPWMDIRWVQKQLGVARVRRLEEGKIQFLWQCPNDMDPTLVMVTSSSGTLLYVRGLYNLDSGSGIFDAELHLPGHPTVIVAPTEILPSTTPVVPTSAPVVIQPSETPITTKPLTTNTQPTATTSSHPEETAAQTHPAINAAVCQNTIQQINDDIKKYKLSSLADIKQDLPWLDLAWLQMKLGRTPIIPLNNTVYVWSNYRLMEQATGGRIAIGDFPGQKDHIPTPDEAIRVLGQPQQMIREPLSKYVWRCQNESALAVIVNSDGKLIDVNTHFCEGMTCASSGISLNGSSAMQRGPSVNTGTATTEKTAIEQATINANISAYNGRLHTSVKNETELTQNMVQRMKNYFANLRACKPGTYQIASPLLLKLNFTDIQIHGMQNGFCMVDEDVMMGTDKIRSNCQYAPQSLALFTDAEAENIAKGNVTFDSSHLTPLQQVMNTQCKRFMNGQPIE